MQTKTVLSDSRFLIQNSSRITAKAGTDRKEATDMAEKISLELAEQLTPEQQVEQGMLCFQEQDYSGAADWFTKAAMAGDPVGQNNLGLCCGSGLGVVQDRDAAFQWYTQSARQGYVKGQYNLGCCYEFGWGTDMDDVQAERWYQAAADQGLVGGFHALEQLHKRQLEEEQTRKEQERAQFVACNQAAQQWDAGAQYQLALCYELGRGTQKDLTMAAKWYEAAARQGHAQAQCALGTCFYSGQGVEKDFAQAVQWYTKAAEQGDARAQHNLAVCFKNGQGVEQDLEQAMTWYKKSADQGYARAVQALEKLTAQLD